MKRWLGVSALAAALGAGAWACDGDTTPANQFDSGADATTDAPTTDAPADSTIDAGPTRAKVIAIHASPDVPAVRVCFGLGIQNDGSDSVVAPLQPLPEKALTGQPYPGLFPGTGGPFPDFGVDLSQKALTPYVIVASKLASSTQNCDALLAPNGPLTPGVDYFKMPTIKNGTFANDTTLALVASGCLPQSADPSATAELCGSDYSVSAGNLAIKIFSLDRAIKGAFGAQFLQASSAAAGEFALAYGSGNVNAALHPLDGGADQPFASDVKYGDLQPPIAAVLSAPDVNQTSLLVTVPGDGGPAVSAPFPLPLVYEATTGQTTGAAAYFASGANYTFVLVGDPAQPTLLDGGAFNGYSLHALAFPNDPPLPAP